MFFLLPFWLAGEPSSSGPQASSGGRPSRLNGHRQSDSAPSTSIAAATADAGGGASAPKRRLVVKPPKQQQNMQHSAEEDSGASSSEAEISDSDDPHEQNHRVKLKIKGRSSRTQHPGDSHAHDSAAELIRAQKVVRGVLKLKAAAPFSRPVNEEEVPGYGLAVQQPMDLGTVLEKLKNGEYPALGSISMPCGLYIYMHIQGLNPKP